VPIYRYRCTNCEHEFESLQTMAEDPLKKCVECLCDDTLEKCISITNFRLLGKGWFKDGYNKI